jgi:integrase/recombinase XerC/integrase/recombinase XerD
LGSACSYWRDQGWLTGDPLVRLRTRPISADRARALTRGQVELILATAAPLRDRVLWTLLYESAARAEEALSLDVTVLDMANRCAVVIRKGGARDVIVWQTGTARLLPRMLAGAGVLHRPGRPSLGRAGGYRPGHRQGPAVVSPGG